MMNKSIPLWFWLVSVLALLWYLMDMSAFFMRLLITEDALLAMSEQQRLHIKDIPTWVNSVFAFEVFGGVFASIGLLLRKKWALALFIVSLLGVLCQTFYIYFLSNAINTIGTPAVVMPIIAIIIGVGMIVFTKSVISKNWLS